jgi:hypothetical protein
MQKRKTIILLKSLSRDELEGFEKFVHSPYFNESERITALLQYLKAFAPAYEHTDLTMENAYAHIFPHEAYDENRIIRLLFRLGRLIERFIGIHTFEQKEEMSFVYRLFFFEEKNHPLLFEQQLKGLRLFLKKNRLPTHRANYARFLLEKAQSNFQHRKQHHTKGDVNLQNSMDALDYFYLVEKLMLATAMYSRQEVITISYQPAFLENILTEIAEKPDQFPPKVRIWYKACQMVRNATSADHYFGLKKELLEHLEEIEKVDGIALLSTLQNGLQRVIGQNDPNYFSELFDLYDAQIQQGWISSPDGMILPALFNNIITVAIKLGRFEWASSFIQKHGKKLKPELKTDLLGYNKARLAFCQEDYSTALRLTATISPKDVFLSLGLRRLQLKIYFEQGDEESLHAAISRFRVYLHRLEQVASRHKESHLAFLNYLSQLLRLERSQDDKVIALKGQITETAILPERDWLLEKVKA